MAKNIITQTRKWLKEQGVEVRPRSKADTALKGAEKEFVQAQARFEASAEKLKGVLSTVLTDAGVAMSKAGAKMSQAAGEKSQKKK